MFVSLVNSPSCGVPRGLDGSKSDPKTAGLMPDQSKAHARSSRIVEEKRDVKPFSIPPLDVMGNALSAVEGLD